MRRDRGSCRIRHRDQSFRLPCCSQAPCHDKRKRMQVLGQPNHLKLRPTPHVLHRLAEAEGVDGLATDSLPKSKHLAHSIVPVLGACVQGRNIPLLVPPPLNLTALALEEQDPPPPDQLIRDGHNLLPPLLLLIAGLPRLLRNVPHIDRCSREAPVSLLDFLAIHPAEKRVNLDNHPPGPLDCRSTRATQCHGVVEGEHALQQHRVALELQPPRDPVLVRKIHHARGGDLASCDTIAESAPRGEVHAPVRRVGGRLRFIALRIFICCLDDIKGVLQDGLGGAQRAASSSFLSMAQAPDGLSGMMGWLR
mmetsp:Transcript_30704/g.77686  ORF Transcript_30704/g.77686 Transcript_30704/m.77686 type:complete len:308 (-) Transcript_30704:1444-2367(-)